MNTTTRRSIVRGAAWAVPVIAVGAAAPMAAASPPPVTIHQILGEGCKEPGGSEQDGTKFGYRFFIEATSSVSDVLTAIACSLPKAGDVSVEHSGVSLVAGVPKTFLVKAYSEKSANGNGTMTFDFLGQTVTIFVSADDFPPCDD